MRTEFSYLFFDTETTGLPNRKARWGAPEQPEVVQLAALLTDNCGNELSSISLIVNARSESHQRALETHGISKETTDMYGVSPITAAQIFLDLLSHSDYRVAHNAQFDDLIMKIMGTQIKYQSLVDYIKRSKPICTADLSTPILNLPPTAKMVKAGFNKPKRASLDECYRHFFKEELEGAHDAMIDVRACARVFFHMRDNNLINLSGDNYGQGI